MAEETTGLRCPECSDVFGESDLGEAVYECSRCGGIDEERRCGDCNIFKAKAADQSCPLCEAPLEEVPESETFWLSADGTVFDSEAEADEYDSPAAVEERDRRAAEAKADLDRLIEESRRAAHERGERMAPRVKDVVARLYALWTRWADSWLSQEDVIHTGMHDLVRSLEWTQRRYEDHEVGGFSTPIPTSVLAVLVDVDLRRSVMLGLDYDRAWEERREVRDQVIRKIVAAAPVLADESRYMEFGGAVHVDSEKLIDALEPILARAIVGA